MNAPLLPPQTQPEMAVEFFRAWFGSDYPDKFVTVSQMAPGNGRTVTRHRHGTPDELCEIVTEIGLDDLVYENDRNWNLYMSVGVMGERPEKAGRKGGKRDIVAVPGVWVDLDTDKHGFFEDEEHCLSLLRNLPEEVWPTIVVATGTGGVHAYWKTTSALGPDEAEKLCTMWWTYLSSRTEAKIDKLVNADRVMKLPGSIRWPKSTSDAPSLVRLSYASNKTIGPETLERIARPSYDAYISDITERRERVRSGRLEATRAVGDIALSGRWGMLMTLSTLEDDFNLRYSWDDILIPLGWTKLDQDSEGRDIWARPGLSQWELHKSAATDFQGSHVMSLFSDSEETGLAHLIDTGVTLTKYRVFVECMWNGDEAAFVRAYLAGEQG